MYTRMLSPVTFSEPPDGGYGWVIVIGAFICLSIASGSQFAFGLFFSDLQTLSDAPLAAGVLSAEYCFLQAFGVVSGLLIERFGERAVVFTGGIVSAIGFVGSSYAPSIEILFLTHGLLVGAGFSLVCTSSGLVVTRWFAKRRATAVGIVVAGSGLGTMAIGPAVQIAIDAFGWRGAMRVVAAITCVIPIASLLFRPIKISNASLQTNMEKNEASMDDLDGKTSSTTHDVKASLPSSTSSLAAGTELVGPSLLCDSLFITWCIALALYSGSFYSVLTHFSTAVKESGTSATGASLLVSLQGFSNIVGRLTMGVLSDVKGISRGYVISLCIAILAISVAALTPFGGFFSFQVAFMVLSGLCGAAVIAATPFLIEFIGMRRIPRALGWTASLQAPLTASIPPLVGLMRARAGSYSTVWLPLGGTMLISAFLAAWVQREAHRRLQALRRKENSLTPLLEELSHSTT